MKILEKKLTSAVLLLAMVISMISVPSISARAEDVKPGLTMHDMAIQYPVDKLVVIPINGLEKGAKVSVKSSNNSIGQVSYNNKSKTAKVKIKKTGKITVTCKITQKGKNYTTTCKIAVFKYVNPVTLLKVGKTDYTSKFNKTNSITLNKNVKREKLQIKLKKGYEIAVIDRNVNGKWTDRYDYKNGMKIDLKKGEFLSVYILDPRGIRVYLNIKR